MLTLVLDTSGDLCSLLLARGENLLWSFEHPQIRAHDRALLPMIQEAFSQTQMSIKDLGRVICVVGPGSFTGLRIGIAAAQGLCLATKAQGIGVTAFEAMMAEQKNPQATLALIPTQTGDFYGQLFQDDQHENPHVWSVPELAPYVMEKGLTLIAPEKNPLLDAVDLPYQISPINAHQAYAALQKSAPLRPLLPFYVRESTPVRLHMK